MLFTAQDRNNTRSLRPDPRGPRSACRPAPWLPDLPTRPRPSPAATAAQAAIPRRAQGRGESVAGSDTGEPRRNARQNGPEGAAPWREAPHGAVDRAYESLDQEGLCYQTRRSSGWQEAQGQAAAPRPAGRQSWGQGGFQPRSYPGAPSADKELRGQATASASSGSRGLQGDMPGTRGPLGHQPKGI